MTRVIVVLLTLVTAGCGGFQVPFLGPFEQPQPVSKADVLFADAFTRLDGRVWREVEVHGQTDYAVVELDGERSLKAESHNGASILIRSIRFQPKDYPWLSWRWRVDQFVEAENLKTKEGADVPARVYVYFETKGLPWQKRNVDYVWSAALPVETLVPSLFAPSSKMLVTEAGRAQGEWKSVTRNIVEDYRRCFKTDRMPPRVIAIGLMTDTDSTGGDALAYYDDVQVSRVAPKTPE